MSSAVGLVSFPICSKQRSNCRFRVCFGLLVLRVVTALAHTGSDGGSLFYGSNFPMYHTVGLGAVAYILTGNGGANRRCN